MFAFHFGFSPNHRIIRWENDKKNMQMSMKLKDYYITIYSDDTVHIILSIMMMDGRCFYHCILNI